MRATYQILPHPELKWTCDASGNWHRVPMILTRTPTGLKEQPAQSNTEGH